MTEDEKIKKINKSIYAIAGLVLILFVAGYFYLDYKVRNYYANNPFSKIINELNKDQADNGSSSK